MIFAQSNVVNVVDDAGWMQQLFVAGSCLLLFLSMALPTVPQLVLLKAGLFAALLAGVGLKCLTGTGSRLDPRIVLWTFSLSTLGFLFVLKGFFAGNPGAAAALPVHVLWPLTFTLWIAGLSRPRTVSALHCTLIVATLFIGLYGCLYVLTELEVLPDVGLASALSLGWEGQGFGTDEGYPKMAIAGMNSLPFLAPYVMASAAVQSGSAQRHPGWRILTWVACAAAWFTVLAAGRRALFLVVLLTPGLILLACCLQPAHERVTARRRVIKFTAVLALAAVVLFAGFTLIAELDLHELWDHFGAGFDLSTQTPDGDAVERRQQFIELSRGWLERPLFGAGLGASVLGSIRSETTPWAYELYYLAILYQTGLVGCLAYAAGIAWIFWCGLKIIGQGGDDAQIMIPLLVGFCGLLIANGTNPYLGKFDEMWTIFVPLSAINGRLLPA